MFSELTYFGKFININTLMIYMPYKIQRFIKRKKIDATAKGN